MTIRRMGTSKALLKAGVEIGEQPNASLAVGRNELVSNLTHCRTNTALMKRLLLKSLEFPPSSIIKLSYSLPDAARAAFSKAKINKAIGNSTRTLKKDR